MKTSCKIMISACLLTGLVFCDVVEAGRSKGSRNTGGRNSGSRNSGSQSKSSNQNSFNRSSRGSSSNQQSKVKSSNNFKSVSNVKTSNNSVRNGSSNSRVSSGRISSSSNSNSNSNTKPVSNFNRFPSSRKVSGRQPVISSPSSGNSNRATGKVTGNTNSGSRFQPSGKFRQPGFQNSPVIKGRAPQGQPPQKGSFTGSRTPGKNVPVIIGRSPVPSKFPPQKTFPSSRGNSPIIGISPVNTGSRKPTAPGLKPGLTPGFKPGRTPGKGTGIFVPTRPGVAPGRRPGIGPIIIVPTKPRNPGLQAGGDGDVGGPLNPIVKLNPAIQPIAIEKPTRPTDLLEGTIIDVDRPGRIPEDNTPPAPGTYDGEAGDLTEGDGVAGNGDVIDQEFLDLINDWSDEGTLETEDNFLHIGQDAPWDNPNDVFWQQDRPDGWKGHWPGQTPGNEIPPGNGDLPPGQDVPPGDEVPPPTGELPPGNDVPPGDELPPGNELPPQPGDDYTPPGDDCPPPICLPPIDRCPPRCPPCVTNVCTPGIVETVIVETVIIEETVIVEQPVLVEEVVEAPVEQQPAPVVPLLQLVVGKPASLQTQGLGVVPGAVAIEVGGIGLPAKVIKWQADLIAIEVPYVGLNGPTTATLHLFDSKMQPIASVPVELVSEPVAE